MIPITKKERDLLQEVGLLQFRQTGYRKQDANFSVANKFHKSRAKTYYVTETPEILKFLGFYEQCGLQKITKSQVNNLIESKNMSADKIQKQGTYIPGAMVYESLSGTYYMDKIARLMIFLGIWKRR